MKPSRALVSLSLLIAGLAFVAAAAGLFWQDAGSSFTFVSLRGQGVSIYGQGLYRYDPVLTGAGFRGVDVVTLLVAVPLLVASVLLYWRGSVKAGVLLTGTLGYFLYNYASMALGAAYNELFLVYIVLFSASLFAFVLAFTSFDLPAVPSHFSPRLPRRAIAAYLFAVGALLTTVWLGDIVGAIRSGRPPQVLASNTTVVTYVLDLGVIAPVAFLAGVLLWRRAPLGYLLASTMLAVNLTIGTALMAQGGAILLAGARMNAGEIAALIGSFAVLTLVGVWLTVVLLRNMSESGGAADSLSARA